VRTQTTGKGKKTKTIEKEYTNNRKGTCSIFKKIAMSFKTHR